MQSANTIIFGAGPAGLMEAIVSARNGNTDIVVLEKRTENIRWSSINFEPTFMLQVLSELQNAGIENITKHHENISLNDTDIKPLKVQSVINGLLRGEAVSTKDIERIYQTYLQKFFPEVKVIRGADIQNIDKNGVTTYVKNGKIESVRPTDRMIIATGTKRDIYYSIVQNLDENNGKSLDEIRVEAEENHEFKHANHATMRFRFLNGDIKSLKRRENYDEQQMLAELKELGWDKDFIPKMLIAPATEEEKMKARSSDTFTFDFTAITRPSKGKIQFNGAVPDNIKTQEDVEKWYNIFIKYFFEGATLIRDYQGQKRVEQFQNIIAKLESEILDLQGRPEKYDLLQEKILLKEKAVEDLKQFSERIEYLKEHEPIRLANKDQKDRLSGTFDVEFSALTNPVFSLKNGVKVISIGDNFMNPHFRYSEGANNAMKHINLLHSKDDDINKDFAGFLNPLYRDLTKENLIKKQPHLKTPPATVVEVY